MQGYQIGEHHFALIFTTVMDELSRGLVEGDEEATLTDRTYWEAKASKPTVAIADQLLAIVKEFDPDLGLKYNKFYIGLAKNNRPNNFVTFIPKKSVLNLEPRMKQAEEIDAKIAASGLEMLGYDKLWSRYRVVLGKEDAKKHETFLRELMRLAFDNA
jgi:predicted transport protein